MDDHQQSIIGSCIRPHFCEIKALLLLFHYELRECSVSMPKNIVSFCRPKDKLSETFCCNVLQSRRLEKIVVQISLVPINKKDYIPVGSLELMSPDPSFHLLARLDQYSESQNKQCDVFHLYGSYYSRQDHGLNRSLIYRQLMILYICVFCLC